MIHERTCEDVQMFIVFVVFNDTHLEARVPLHQHR